MWSVVEVTGHMPSPLCTVYAPKYAFDLTNLLPAVLRLLQKRKHVCCSSGKQRYATPWWISLTTSQNHSSKYAGLMFLPPILTRFPSTGGICWSRSCFNGGIGQQFRGWYVCKVPLECLSFFKAWFSRKGFSGCWW